MGRLGQPSRTHGLTLAAEVPNGATVTLRVDRRIGESNKYENGVATQTYKVRRNFGMDFF